MSRTAGLIARRTAIAASFVLAFGGSFGAAHAASNPLPDLNHYQCYQIADGGSGLKADVTLRDQFRDDGAIVVKASMLCNPVDKNGEGIPNEKAHLVCYFINVRTPDDPDKTYEVTIHNQFEDARYWVKGPQMLCVPSLKELMR